MACTPVMPSADCYTDHRLVRAKLAFTFKPPPKKKGPQTKKLYVHRLHQPEIEAAFQARLVERLQHPPNPDPSTQWQGFKTAVQESAAETFGFSVRKTKTGSATLTKPSKISSTRNAPAIIISYLSLMTPPLRRLTKSL